MLPRPSGSMGDTDLLVQRSSLDEFVELLIRCRRSEAASDPSGFQAKKRIDPTLASVASALSCTVGDSTGAWSKRRLSRLPVEDIEEAGGPDRYPRRATNHSGCSLAAEWPTTNTPVLTQFIIVTTVLDTGNSPTLNPSPKWLRQPSDIFLRRKLHCFVGLSSNRTRFVGHSSSSREDSECFSRGTIYGWWRWETCILCIRVGLSGSLCIFVYLLL